MYRKQITFAQHALPVAVIIALPCAWFWPLLTGYLPHFMDTVTQIWPYRVAAARQIREGVLPLWMPNIFCGMPCAANPQIAVWYPLQLFFYLIPTAFGYGALCVAHYIIGGLGAYALTHRLTRDRLASAFAAFTFQFGSMLISHIALTPHLYTAVWIPWMIWSLEGTRGRNRVRPALMLGLFVALQILAGAPQITYYTMLLLPVYWVARRYLRFGARGAAEAIAQVAGGYALALLIAGIQILPTLDFLSETRRGPIDPARLGDQALNGSFMWRALVGFTLDGFEDTDTINAIGFGALALVAIGLARRSTRGRVFPFLLMGLVAWLLAIGALVPAWSRILPMYSSFHAPRRALVVWSVVGPVAAGVGAVALRRWLRSRRLPRLVYPAALVIALSGTVWILPRLEREFVKPDHLAPDPRLASAIGGERYITVDPTLNYSYGSRRERYGASMLPDLACANNMNDAQGYDPLIFWRYALARDFACARSGVFYPSHGVFFTDPGSHYLDLMGVSYIVGRWDLFDTSNVIPGTGFNKDALEAKLERVVDDPEWPLFRFRTPRQLAWIPPEVMGAASPEAAIASISPVEPRSIAFVETADPLPDRQTIGPVEATMADPRTYRMTFASPLPASTLAVLSVPYSRGWKATSAGEALPVYPANGFLCGVVAPAGVREIMVKFEPSSFRYGMAASGIGLCAWLLAWVRTRRSRASR